MDANVNFITKFGCIMEENSVNSKLFNYGQGNCNSIHNLPEGAAYLSII